MVFQKADIFILQDFVLSCSMNILYTQKHYCSSFKKTDKYLSVHWFVEHYSAVISSLWNLKVFFWYKPFISGWFEEGTWIGSWASCSAAHGRWRGHGSCQEDCQSPRRIIVWQRAWKTNWAAYCHLWPEQNAKLLTAGNWMENTSKGIIQKLFFNYFIKDSNRLVHNTDGCSILHSSWVSFTNRLGDLKPKWRSGWGLVIAL